MHDPLTEDSNATSQADRCASCRAELAGPYCHQCGERVLVPADWSVARLLGAAFSQLADLDSRLLRTLRWLATKPGGLAAEYFAGRRNRYLRPLQLFLLANVVYFFIQPWVQYSGYNTPLKSQLNQQFYSAYLPVEAWVSAKAAALSVSAGEFQSLFDAQSDLLARSLVFLMVPALALLLKLVFAARPARLAEHGVLAIHYYAFELLFLYCLFLSFWPQLVMALGDAGALTFLGPSAWILLEFGGELVKMVYWYFTLRRFYQLKRLPAMALTVLLVAGLLVITLGYRLTLLLTTLLTL